MSNQKESTNRRARVNQDGRTGRRYDGRATGQLGRTVRQTERRTSNGSIRTDGRTNVHSRQHILIDHIKMRLANENSCIKSSVLRKESPVVEPPTTTIRRVMERLRREWNHSVIIHYSTVRQFVIPCLFDALSVRPSVSIRRSVSLSFRVCQLVFPCLF